MHRTSVASLLAAAVLVLAACTSASAAKHVPLADPPRTLLVGTPAGLAAAVDSARVVCVGELHDRREHHAVQRDVLERMAARGGPVLLGMEMFQRPFQQPLDDYVAGKIDEREMLRRTEYFSRWRFDHTMYAPLWQLCRERGIRIVALNAEADIARKVGREGLAALTPDERSRIAAEIDLHVEAHRARILEVFGPAEGGGAHGVTPERRENLYAAMVVWDETMAETAAQALTAAGPGARMLVVAGGGHIHQFTGIPARIARRIGEEPVVIACRSAGQEPEAEPAKLGHFVVETPDETLPAAPLLGVRFAEGSMAILQVVPGGNAERIGMRAGDVLTHISGTDGVLVEVKDLTDLRWVIDRFWLDGGKGGLIRWTRGTETVAATYDLLAPPEETPSAQP